ncbi:MAG: ABC transporter permease subunit [Myxococcota bacterium]
MRNTLAIAGKEIRIYFTTATSYVVLGSFALIIAFFFQALIGDFQRTIAQTLQMDASWLEQLNLTDYVMYPLIMNIGVILIFFTPIITMRLLADEKRGKTLELLMTAPVRPVEIVLGKYLGGLAMMLAMLGVTLLFPLVVQLLGASETGSPLDWRSVGVGYFGAALLGAAFVAIGLFTSSLTDNPVIAALLGFLILLMFYIAGSGAAGSESIWKSLLEFLSLSSNLTSFARGVLRTPSLVYYLSISVFALFLTYRVVEAQRWR